NPVFELTTRDVLAAASVMGLKVQKLEAHSDREIDIAFASLVEAQTRALLVGSDVFFNNRIEQVVALAARYAIPTMYAFREFVTAGGVIRPGATRVSKYLQRRPFTERIPKG